MSLIKEVNFGGKNITFEFNKFAKQASGSVLVSCGETQVLVTVCAASSPKEGQSFFPLTVDYIEKFYAVGKIPGGFIKRETRPSELETLTARVIDRPLRPLFPENYMCETQIVATVLSCNLKDHHPAPLATIGASVALHISDIPFDGPIASIRLGLKDGEYIVDPNEPSDLDLTLSAKPDAILMVEAGANFLSEAQMLDAISHGHNLMKPVFELQEEVRKEIGVAKRVLEEVAEDTQTLSDVERVGKAAIIDAIAVRNKTERSAALKAAAKGIMLELNPDGDSEIAGKVSEAIETFKYNYVRSLALDENIRMDGRQMDEIRNIACETKLLKRAHGSALFTRGETQALAVVTLGAGEDEQKVETITTTDSKRFMLHYNFPPFSVGEARPLRSPGRREIGHGALAERALSAVIPNAKEFGYTIRLVSEVLESNGSSSMATVCGGTMALLDSGVPLKEPVAGIAMGLISDGSRYKVLSDILGDEDHLGDMDFKVCGSKNGLTALQMDIKIGGLSREILEIALNQAKEGRLHILGKMESAISTPSEISDYAPRIFHIKINEDKIKDLIGPGGKTIKRIVAETGVKIDIEDSGLVSIVSPDADAAEAAKTIVRGITTDPEIGEVILGTVKRIVDFGAFIEIKPGVDGLCHISQLDDSRVEKVTDILKEGEQCMVKIIDIDRQGRIKLSRKDALDKKPE